MKLNELIQSFEIALSNEEAKLLDTFEGVMLPEEFTEREQRVIENMIRKSVVTKIAHQGKVYLVKNEQGIF
jgi:hypothetical protein|tara:strand:- start:3490 stop:3702 length:213 start_codon:yes stop_codon:yes gene_type:complete